jgi:hypothetical protein
MLIVFFVVIKQLGFFSQNFITDLDGLDPHDEPADVADDLGEDDEGKDEAAPSLPSPPSPPPSKQLGFFFST